MTHTNILCCNDLPTMPTFQKFVETKLVLFTDFKRLFEMKYLILIWLIMLDVFMLDI